MKIILQRLWELRLDWDDVVPEHIRQAWDRWRSELLGLSTCAIPRCYFPREKTIVSMQIHGFSDASENAYAGVVYLRLVDSCSQVHVSLVMALVLARLIKEVYNVPLSNVYAWTDSTVVLSW